MKKALRGAPIDEALEHLFARGIDPTDVAASAGSRRDIWAPRDDVRAVADEADRRVLDALGRADLDRPGDPLLDRAEVAFAILEHEAMHQETLLSMWHRLPFELKRRPPDHVPETGGAAPAEEWIAVAPGRARIGVSRDEHPFAWDNERPAFAVDAGAFSIQRHDVLEFVESGGYADERPHPGERRIRSAAAVDRRQRGVRPDGGAGGVTLAGRRRAGRGLCSASAVRAGSGYAAGRATRISPATARHMATTPCQRTVRRHRQEQAKRSAGNHSEPVARVEAASR